MYHIASSSAANLHFFTSVFFHFITGADKVFTHDDGTPIHPDTFSKRLRKILDDNDFDCDFHTHTLRHFFTTYQLQNDTSKQVVAALVGHSDTGYLERTYCHPQLEYKVQAADMMSDFLRLPEQVTSDFPALQDQAG